MSRISDYKYRQLRNMVNRAKVRKSVKNLLYCTLRDYKTEGSEAASCLWEQDKKRCLIGAAVHNIGVYNIQGGLNWVAAANRAFGTTITECDSIVEGFDSSLFDEGGTTKERAGAFGKNNRVANLANRLRLELIVNG
jgi:hypothetical protein